MNFKTFIDYLYSKTIKSVFYFLLPVALFVNLASMLWLSTVENSSRPYYLFNLNMHILSGMILICVNILLIYDYFIVRFGWRQPKLGKPGKPYLTKFMSGGFQNVIAFVWSVLLIHFSVSGMVVFFYSKNRSETFYAGNILLYKLSHEIFLWVFLAVTLVYYYFVFGKIARNLFYGTEYR